LHFGDASRQGRREEAAVLVIGHLHFVNVSGISSGVPFEGGEKNSLKLEESKFDSRFYCENEVGKRAHKRLTPITATTT
jgi:hypothetical protein